MEVGEYIYSISLSAKNALFLVYTKCIKIFLFLLWKTHNLCHVRAKLPMHYSSNETQFASILGLSGNNPAV